MTTVKRPKHRSSVAARREVSQVLLNSLAIPAALSLVRMMQCGNCLFHRKGRCSRTRKKVDPKQHMGCEAWKGVSRSADGKSVEVDAVYIHVQPCRRVARSIESRASVIFDFNDRGQVCGIEVLEDSRLVRALSGKDGYDYKSKKGGWQNCGSLERL